MTGIIVAGLLVMAAVFVLGVLIGQSFYRSANRVSRQLVVQRLLAVELMRAERGLDAPPKTFVQALGDALFRRGTAFTGRRENLSAAAPFADQLGVAVTRSSPAFAPTPGTPRWDSNLSPEDKATIREAIAALRRLDKGRRPGSAYP